VLRVTSKHTATEIATGLSLPTAMTFGPDGNLYVSNNGFGFPAGQGEIVKDAVKAPWLLCDVECLDTTCRLSYYVDSCSRVYNVIVSGS
jgi:hypothetical protein